ncbi:DEAD/DEAH box helicase [Rhizobacter sp. LjRoot28]|uniref:DEAD/DEAH box helicase n=1 Tax=Rhizobacter sp. LjRoot28 TaxID=3342309 RepID=UPI003F50887B
MTDTSQDTSRVDAAAPPPAVEFSTLPLAPMLQRAIADSGYTMATPIQAKAIPLVLAGRDVMGAAQTGTGKTAAFSLPLLQKMLKHETSSVSPARHPVRALVLAPTRELADQVANNIKAYAKHSKLRVAVVFGGVDMKPQTLELKAGVEVLIATPGRLLDHIEAKNCVLNQVEYVVLDEADRMLDIGFLPDLQRILSYLPKQRQTLLFSATFSTEIKRLAESYLQDPILVEVARPNATATNVEQRFYSVTTDDKRAAVVKVLADRGIKQAIVFVNSKLGCARLARSLERDGLKTNALHGDKSQDERLKALDAFKKGETDVLVCTDVAARGLDIADLPAVINFDVPFNAEDYVHRIGRTGRAGASGLAVTLVTRDDTRLMGDIEKLIKKKLELEPLEFDSSRPRPEAREGRPERAPRRSWDDAAGPGESAPRPTRSYAPPKAAPRDPFFDRPYEPSGSGEASWESKAAPVPSARVSPNIKPKRKVAALFGGKKAD